MPMLSHASVTVSCAILGLVLVVTRDGWLQSVYGGSRRTGYQSAAAALHCDAPRTAIAGGKTVNWPPTVTNLIRRSGGHYPRCGLPTRVTVRSNSGRSAFGNITSINDERCGRARRSGDLCQLDSLRHPPALRLLPAFSAGGICVSSSC